MGQLLCYLRNNLYNKLDVVLHSLMQLAKSSLERRLHEAERRLAFRPRPTSASRDELLFRIEQLQREQGEWRKKVEDLEALNSHYLKEKLELAQDRNTLEQKLQVRGVVHRVDQLIDHLKQS